MAKKRLTREESRAQTQQRLLEAAAKAFAQHGFEGASLEEITEAAGYSRGAFYSNFKNKDELFLALIEQNLTQTSDELKEIMFAVELKPKDTLSAFRNYYTRLGKIDKDGVLLITEAQLYAVRHTKFRSKLNALFAEMQESLRRSLEKFQKETGLGGRIDPDLLAFTGIALSHGLILHNLMDPKNYSDESVKAALATIFDLLSGTSTS